jgi:hypothetical protein
VAGSLFERAKVLFQQSEPESTAVAPRKLARPFHAVVIVPGRHACPGAYALRERRFLSREAPVLPLQGCGAEECSCCYEHYDDRRERARRTCDLGIAVDGHVGPDKRSGQKRGRRKVDGR